jgi:PAS domain S-box-containing protein
MSEAVLSALFDKTTTPMLLAGDNRCYLAANSAACELLGRSARELTELKVDDLVAPDARPGVPALWREFLRSGSQAGEIELRRADGSMVAVSYSATANIVPGLHLTVFPSPGREDPILDRPRGPAVGSRRPTPLTAREQQVMTLLALGCTGAEIASRLYLSPETVRTHTRRARAKLGARTRSQAIALAVKSGQIDPEG